MIKIEEYESQCEYWRIIKDYPKYSISSFGRVKNHTTGRILKLYNKKGYLQVALSRENKAKYFIVHRLVAKTFLYNKEEKPQVNHKDGNKLNNNVNNLEWVTASENTKHACSTGLINQSGENNNGSKYLEKDIKFVKEYKKLRPEATQQQISDITGIDRRYIGHILSGKVWRHVV